MHHPVKIKSPPQPKARLLTKQPKKQEEPMVIVEEKMNDRNEEENNDQKEDTKTDHKEEKKKDRKEKKTDRKEVKKIDRKEEVESEGASRQKKPPKVQFTDEEVVWARVRGFPPHPAYIVIPEVTKKEVPGNVLASKGKDDNVLVWFFLVSEAHTW
jgi:hypothetical protein